MENTRDTIISIGNNVRDLTNSWLKNNFRPAAEDSVWIQPIKRKKKKKKKNLLSWLSSAVWKKKKKKTWLKVLSALFSTVYWSPKTVPWLPAKIYLLLWQPVQTGESEEKQRRAENMMADVNLWLWQSVCGGVLEGFDSPSHVILLSLWDVPCSYLLQDLTRKHLPQLIITFIQVLTNQCDVTGSLQVSDMVLCRNVCFVLFFLQWVSLMQVWSKIKVSGSGLTFWMVR